MKRIKKIISVMLTLAMALTMSVTAFGEIQAVGEKTNHTYEIFQIFTGDYSGDRLTNIKWGKNGTGTEGEKVDADTLEQLQAIADSNVDTEKLAVISSNADLDSQPIMTDNTTEYKGLDQGYYLVRDKIGSQSNSENGSYTLYVVQVVDNGVLKFEPKSGVPTSDKKIVSNNGDLISFNQAAIGDVVTYRLTGTLPDRFDDYKTYYYVFTDTLSKGLSYNGNQTVSVNVCDKDGNVKQDVTKYFYKGEKDNGDGTTTVTIGIQDLKALELVGVDFEKDDEIRVTYTATLNKDAVIGEQGNINDVVLSYTNDPNNSGNGSTEPPEEPDEPESEHPIGVTPKKEVKTYTTELAILKTDEKGEILSDAKFTLSGDNVKITLVTEEKFEEADDGVYWKLSNNSYTMTPPKNADDDDYADTGTRYKLVTRLIEDGNVGEPKLEAEVGKDGRIVFTGLGIGSYTLEESYTPAGYNTIDPIKFTIDFVNEKFTIVDSTDNIELRTNNTLQANIINQKGSLLPSTGGIGTTIFYIVGGIIVVGAAILLVTKKRMSKEA